MDISNPRAVLEKHLRDYSCMTKGDVFQFTYNGRMYAFKVLELKPDNVVSLIETDMSVDFAPPLDYVEPEKPSTVKEESSTVHAGSSGGTFGSSSAGGNAGSQMAPGPVVGGKKLEPDVHVVPNLRDSVSQLGTSGGGGESTGIRLDGKKAKTETVAAPPLKTRLTLGTSTGGVSASEAKPGASTSAGTPASTTTSAAPSPPVDDYWSKLGSGNTLKTKKK